MKIFRNTLACLVGLFVGSVVNMALVTLGPHVIATPEGVDMTNPEMLSQTAHLLEPRNFLFPFLAHALGTLVGALVAFLVAGSHKAIIAFVVGVLFLAGGVVASLIIPAPSWFIATDLLFAYLPMAWLGVRVAQNMGPLSDAPGAPKA